MPQKQISGHGEIVFLQHPYQMANQKSILEMWLAGLDMAKILAIQRKWTLNGMTRRTPKNSYLNVHFLIQGPSTLDSLVIANENEVTE